MLEVPGTRSIQVLVLDILNNPQRYKWTQQGFGFLRTYLPGDARLNIWDQRLIYDPRPSLIHDHPWDFNSIVIFGAIINTLYEHHGYDAERGNYFERVIRPGEGTVQLQEDRRVVLREKQPQPVLAGQGYFQTWNQIHKTDYTQSTVTLNLRERGDHVDKARVFYAADSEWVTAEPKPADMETVYRICNAALEKWG